MVTFPLRFRLPRLVFAALAVLGLLGSTVRPLLACSMAETARGAEVRTEAHAAHHGDHSAPAEEDAPAPVHEPCPDLAHCAVLAWTPQPLELPSGTPRPEVRVGGRESRPASAGRAIETPPPKRV